MFILLALPIVSETNSVNVSDNFVFCDASTETLIDFESSCLSRKRTQNQI